MSNKEDAKPATNDNQGRQLSLDFMEDFSVSPAKIFESPDRLYAFPEFLKRPFFLNKNSQKVKQSRRTYNESDIRKRLQKAKKEDGTPYTEEEIKQAVSVAKQDLLKTYDDGWSIAAAMEYGLPNETDGHIWDYVAQKVSDIYLSDGKFHSVYFFTEEELMGELQRLGVFTTRGGRQRQMVADSVARLQRTVYKLEKNEEDNTTGKTRASVEFSLISAVFRAGKELPDGSVHNKTALAINPIIIQALREDKYFIIANERRRHIKKYGAKTLYDRLAFWAYIQYKKDEIRLHKISGLQPHQVIGYEKLCDLLGLEPLKNEIYKKSRVKKQVESVVNELVTPGVLDWFDIEQYTLKGEKKFNFIFAYSDAFVQEVTDYISQKEKLERKITAQYLPPDSQVLTDFRKKVFKRLKSKKTRDKLQKTN